MKSARPYSMDNRATAVEETRARIQEAVVALAAERMLADISLADVAATAGVTTRTVLRQFGSKDGLIHEAATRMRQVVATERSTPSGDVDTALRTLVDHYEKRAALVLLLLAQESTDPMARSLTEGGKRYHRDWVGQVFDVDPDGELADLLVVATDIYTWKLLRRDRGLSRRRAEDRMKRLVRAILTSSEKEFQ